MTTAGEESQSQSQSESTADRTERHAHSVSQHAQAQSALNEKGKRHINMVWEVTQACIALAVTGVGLYASLTGISSESLNNTLFLVIGFYFGRTNHARPTTIFKG